ncbi:hypothetical protein ACH40F_47040 [Streptomyces sp. NPDC020794]
MPNNQIEAFFCANDVMRVDEECRIETLYTEGAAVVVQSKSW